MCGIVGMVGSQDRIRMRDILLSMRHRGPDSLGVHYDKAEKSMWGHCRLSIMDPQGGDQPLYNEDGNIKLVANGEIYNSAKLRKTLEGKHSFKTTSDCECALHLYEEYGDSFVSMLDGMYSIALSDGDKYLVARDPLGIKPLYYAYGAGGEIYFSSEAKSLQPYADKIEEFPPGCYYSSSDKGFTRFYEVPEIDVEKQSADLYIENIRSVMTGAVRKRLMSDVPLGCFLSGGLDSSIITAIAVEYMDEPVHTFSVGFKNSPDLEKARVVSRHLKTIHHEYLITEDDIRKELGNIIFHLESFDQDLVRSAIPTYFTSRLASERVKVILTGEGADELFAGYTYYKDIDDPDSKLGEELRRSISCLHNMNLQRVDRLTMAHSIEGRVPFLDLDMIELAQKIPVEYKLRGEPAVEKWILRKAFEDMLPREIVWREKAQFDEGSGIADFMPKLAERMMSDAEYRRWAKSHPDRKLRSKEEALYHKIFNERFSGAGNIEATVARWADRPEF